METRRDELTPEQMALGDERRANDYANDAIKAEQISPPSGPENDLDCVGRPLKAGT